MQIEEENKRLWVSIEVQKSGKGATINEISTKDFSHIRRIGEKMDLGRIAGFVYSNEYH